MTILKKVFGVLSACLTAFVLMTSVYNLSCAFGWIASKNSVGANLIAVLFLWMAAVGGFFFTRWCFGKALPSGNQALNHDQQVRLILNLARQSDGDVTLLQVAAETGLSIDQSRILLEDLVTQGLSQMVVDDDGVMLYAFPDLNPQVLKPKYLQEPDTLN